MGFFRDIIRRLITEEPFVKRAAPCPNCREDVTINPKKTRQDGALIFYLCQCGHGSAWSWEDRTATLIYGQLAPEPEDDDDADD